MNYENMSDLQLNLLVANSIGVDVAENSGVVYGSVKHCGDNVISVIGVVDYCNNPSDAWPIIFDNEISMCKPRKSDDVWNCFNRNCDVSVVENLTYHQNPLRAAMIVFLKIQEAKRG